MSRLHPRLIPLGLGVFESAQICLICRFASSRIIWAHRFVSFKSKSNCPVSRRRVSVLMAENQLDCVPSAARDSAVDSPSHLSDRPTFRPGEIRFRLVTETAWMPMDSSQAAMTKSLRKIKLCSSQIWINPVAGCASTDSPRLRET